MPQTKEQVHKEIVRHYSGFIHAVQRYLEFEDLEPKDKRAVELWLKDTRVAFENLANAAQNGNGKQQLNRSRRKSAL